MRLEAGATRIEVGAPEGSQLHPVDHSPVFAVYSGTKGAIISFSKTLAREMARNKITVNVVCPDPTMTPLDSNFALEYAIMPVWPLFHVLRSQCHSREFEAVIRVGRAISCNSSDRANDRTVTLMFQGDELSRAY